MYKLKKCPFCRGDAELIKEPLWDGSHGYYNCYDFYVACTNEKCKVKPKTNKFDTIYEKNEDIQKEKAINAWNIRQ